MSYSYEVDNNNMEANMGWKLIIYVVVVFFLYFQISANHSLIMKIETMLDQKGIKQISNIQDSDRTSEYMAMVEERMIVLVDNRITATNEELIRVNNRLNEKLNEAIEGVNYWVSVIEENRLNVRTHRHERHISEKPILTNQ